MKSPGSVARVGRVAFELSRLEVVGDRCQVEGQWFGVRGRRFMRPALTVVVDGQPIRLLADLADKPWAAEDGEPWKATFPCAIARAEGGEAELTVAPDITIRLPAPQRRVAAAKETSASRRGAASRQPGARRMGSGSETSPDTAFDRLDRPRRETRSPAVGGERDDADALMQELADLRDSERRLRERLDRGEADRAKTAQRLDEVSRQLREVMHEREESNAARDRIAAELEAAQRERSHALAERDAAVAARDEAVSAREALSRTTERLQSELAGLLSARGAALVMRRAAQTPAVSRRYARIIPGAITIAIVLVIVLILVVLLHVV
jgi:hypothetical protein